MVVRSMSEEESVAVAVVAGAVVRPAIAPMLCEPLVSSGQVTQQLAGHSVEILEEQSDWFRVRGTDEYEGWLHRGYLTRVFDAPPARDEPTRISLGCVTRDPAGGTRALPLRAILDPRETVLSGEVIDARELAHRFPPHAAAITRSGQELFVGTSYQWGGVTPWGADCSGFAQAIFALHGVPLPRDAWQQAQAGDDGGRDILSARIGELLFFSDRADGHVTHVAISLGGRRLVHLALGRGGFGIERLDDVRDPYVRKLHDRFLFIRRVLPD
jgi:gamma-D-glutamyl-L-lysine dipeptidyl-peptidase